MLRRELASPGDPVRIAGILRNTSPWSASTPSALDLAQQALHKHRQLVDTAPANVDCGSKSVGSCDARADVKIGQLAERMSALISDLSQQGHSARQEFRDMHRDVERQLERAGKDVESRVGSLEARLVICEGALRKRGEEEESRALDGARIMRETRNIIGGGMADVQGHWRSHRAEFDVWKQKQEQDYQKRMEVVEETRQGATQRFHVLETTMDEQVRRITAFEHELRALDPQRELDGLLATLESRLSEERMTFEAQLHHVRGDVESTRARLESSREEVLDIFQRTVDQELERVLDQIALRDRDQEAHRFEDIDSRLAAVRMRVESHEGRLTNVCERAEAACQQALEGAQTCAWKHRQEILAEVDCQLGLIRQRVDATEELCDELSLRSLSSRWCESPKHHARRGGQVQGTSLKEGVSRQVKETGFEHGVVVPGAVKMCTTYS